MKRVFVRPLAILVVLGLLASPARAERVKPAFYIEALPAAGFAKLDEPGIAVFGLVRHGTGLELRAPSGMHVRAGIALDFVWAGREPTTWLGGEAEVSWRIDPLWRLGGHATVVTGASRASRYALVSLGPRARYDRFALGADVLVPLSNPRGTGFLIGAGINGIPAAFTFGAALAFFAISSASIALD